MLIRCASVYAICIERTMRILVGNTQVSLSVSHVCQPGTFRKGPSAAGQLFSLDHVLTCMHDVARGDRWCRWLKHTEEPIMLQLSASMFAPAP